MSSKLFQDNSTNNNSTYLEFSSVPPHQPTEDWMPDKYEIKYCVPKLYRLGFFVYFLPVVLVSLWNTDGFTVLFTSCSSNFPSSSLISYILWLCRTLVDFHKFHKTMQCYNQCPYISPLPYALFSTLCKYLLFLGITIKIST